MPTLALPGGTSPSLGQAIVAAIMASRWTSSWKIVILSRSSRAPAWLRAIDQESTRTTIRTVDYMSVESPVTALKGIHTVISVTSAIDGTQAQIQINILNAALRAGCVRDACMKHKGEIEFANFNHGSFMNYLGHGIYPFPSRSESDEATDLVQLKKGGGYIPGEDEACQGLRRQGPLADQSGAFLVGLKNGIAELPVKDDGQWPRVTMTSMRGVGQFVAASLNVPKWEENMNMAGDTLTMGELLAHAEAVTGKKFKVVILKREDLEKRMAGLAEDDFMGQMWAEFNLAYVRDLEDVVVLRPTVNSLCPEVKPTSMREYMEMFWSD